MGQVSVPPSTPTLILTALDRLVASNADGGLAAGASHIILLGQAAGQNLGPLSNVIALGFNTLAAGNGDAANSGMVVIGGLSLAALTNSIPSPTEDGPSTVVGFNNFPLLANRFGSNTVYGEGIGATLPAAGGEIARAILIGTDVYGFQRSLNANGVGITNSVIMGNGALRGAGPFANPGAGVSVQSCIIIGRDACGTSGVDAAVPGVSISNSIAIGANTGQQWASVVSGNNIGNTVAIGHNCVSGQRAGSDSVFIGSGITTSIAGVTDAVVIGAGIPANFAAGAGNTIIGSQAQIGIGIGVRNLVLGFRAGSGLTGGTNDKLLLETDDGANTRTWLYGLAATAANGGLVVGQSVAASRDLPGFNILKLINGTVTGVAPVGGGFFYCAAGVLHWVDANNTDSVIAGSSTISPAALGAGNNNDYAPAGIGATGTIRTTVNGGGSTITGINAGALAGKRLAFFNIAGAANLTFTNEDVASAAANRILTPNAAALVVRPQGSAILWYDSTSARWRVEAQAA